MNTDPKTYLYAFEKACHALISGDPTGNTVDYDKLTEWSKLYPGFSQSMWTIAHFSYPNGQTPLEAAKAFFAETQAGKNLKKFTKKDHRHGC